MGAPFLSGAPVAFPGTFLIYQIAKNCRTSEEMIEKYYAAHLKTQLDAAPINIMRPRPRKTTSRKGPGRVEGIRLAEEA
jgi:hypothetical protein